jgi:hypothetical protein
MGTVAGVPDLILVREGHTFGLELKNANGRPSDDQKGHAG